MKLNFKFDKYWIAIGFLCIILIYLLYPSSPFKSASLKISRSEAEKTAKEYLQEKGIDISEYWVETFLPDNSVINKYVIRKLGNEGYDELSKNKNWNLINWNVYFHKNLSREVAQTTYTVEISNYGEVLSYSRQIPDTMSIQSISKEEAENLMRNTINENLSVDLSGFEMIESREENLSNRTDYSFLWEKSSKEIEGKWQVRGTIQGNEPGNYEISFLVPDNYRQFFDTSQALFGTFSAIFVAFLMVFSLYYFLKKYHQGEVWINVGKSLFFIYFIVAIFTLINVWPNLGPGTQIGNLSYVTVKLIVVLLNGLLIQFLLALLVFATWAVGESYGREFWPDKLKGTDSIIKGKLFTLSSGSSLLRGLVLGIAVSLVYLILSIVLNQPGSNLFISPHSEFEIFYGYVPLVSAIGNSFTSATLGGIVVVFFVVNLSYSKWKKRWISIAFAALATILANVIAVTPPSLNNLAANIFMSALFGVLVGYIYFRFDLLTTLGTLFYSSLTYSLYTLTAAQPEYYLINTILVLGVFALVPAIYIISRIRKEEFELEDYGLPSHIEKISERERLKQELEIAAKVQLSLLPKEQPSIEGYEISSLSIPAREAGGDYYDYVKLSDNKLGIAIGDVSGKGVGAAIYMTLTKGILQAHAEENVSPKIVLGKVNRLLYKTIEKNSFVSMFYAILDTNNHSLLYSRAGHNPGIFCSFESQQSKLLKSKGIALGLEEGTVFQETLIEDTISLKQGDVVVFYTDGFTEAMNERLDQYGEERLIELIQNNRDKKTIEILDIVLRDVNHFTKSYPQHDDMTIVILKRK